MEPHAVGRDDHSVRRREVLKLAQQQERAVVMRMLIGESLRNPRTARSLFAAGPGRGLKFLSQWMERHVRQGSLRPLPPRQLARQFMGPLFSLVLFKVLFDFDEPIGDDLAERHVDAFLEGAQAR
ncbi:MAG: TetR/AcrR family transcriptional regulator C-terminal domain-containing protein [Candidatus Xenobia bacterium]